MRQWISELKSASDLEARLGRAVHTAFQPSIDEAIADIRREYQQQQQSTIAPEAATRVANVKDAAITSFGTLIDSMAMDAIRRISFGEMLEQTSILSFCYRQPQIIDALRDKVVEDLQTFAKPLSGV